MYSVLTQGTNLEWWLERCSYVGTIIQWSYPCMYLNHTNMFWHNTIIGLIYTGKNVL
jgi:hypothetical protein